MPSMTFAQAFELALQHHRAGRRVEAEHLYRLILAQQPNHPPVNHSLGILCAELGRLTEAEQFISRAIAIDPAKADYHNHLGMILAQQGRIDPAIESFRSAVRVRPDFAEGWFNLGRALINRRLPVEAIEALRTGLQIKPDSAAAQYSLGVALTTRGELDQAIAAYRAAIQIQPNLVAAYHNLAVVLSDQGELQQAVAAIQTAIQLHPQSATIHSNLMYGLHFVTGDAGEIYRQHRHWNQVHAEPLSKFINPHENDRDPHRRLRIGYVSPHLFNHAVGRFMLPLLEHQDQTQFEAICYTSDDRADHITERLRAAASGWNAVWDLSDEQLAERIRADRIDILIDLTMHMSGSRLMVFARKPAPIQACYLAYCSTTGMDAMDYRLADNHLDPPGMDEKIYSETSIRLTGSYWCYQAPQEAPPLNPLPALSGNTVTFACLNNFSKATPPTLQAWIKILLAIPNSRLIIHAHAGSHRQRVLNQFAEHGIRGDRIAFVGFQTFESYLRLHHQVDIALDPFPYGGGTTTCDALWMGVPVITLKGTTAVGRGGVSILSNLGLPELIALDAAEYVRIAAQLAIDLPQLALLRAGMRDRMLQTSLMNAPAFAKSVEQAYKTMWQRWSTQR